MASCVCCCSSGSALVSGTIRTRSFILPPIRIAAIVPANASSAARSRISRLRVRASTVDSSSDFVKRMERSWLISQQPSPIVCSSCNTKGHVECKWCGGTGFFIIGDNMLCEVPSKNTTCVICAGKGSTCCSDCQGTGHRAKWLEDPPTSQ